LAGLSSFFPLALILVNGVNVPFWDEWWLTGLIKAIQTGQASFETFWAPNNEHRIPIPKAVFSLLIPATGWNSIAIMVISWLVVMSAGLFLFYSFTRVFNPLRPRLWLATIGVAFLLFFSPIQKENWLWAFQLGFFLVQGAVIVSLLYISFTDIALGKRLALSVAFAIVASFSSAQGLLVWPVLLVIVLIGDDTNKDKMVGAFVLIAATAAMYALYLHNYPKMPSYRHLPLGDILRAPQVPFLYFVGLLGAPLTSWVPSTLRVQSACCVGSFLLLCFFWLCYTIFKNHKQGRAAGWIGLGCFALAFCMMTTYGRGALGIDTAVLVGRYTTHTLLFVIVIVTFPHFLFDVRTGSRTGLKWVGNITLLCGFAVCILLGYLFAFNDAAKESRPRITASKLLPFFAYFDPRCDGLTTNPFSAVCAVPPGWRMFDNPIRPYIDLGYVRTISGVPFMESSKGLDGECRFMGRQENGSEELLVLAGKVTAPKTISPRLLFLRNKGQETFIAATALRAGKTSEFERSYKWQLAVAIQLLGSAGETLEAWIYDNEKAAFLKVQEIDAEGLGSRLMESLPGNLQDLPITDGGVCIVERANGEKGISASLPVKGILKMEGWAAVSVEQGVAPDAVFLTLTDASGRIHYLKSPLMKRPDVNAYFHKPEMGDTGFSFRGNLAAIHGEFRLKMLLVRKNTIYRFDLGKNIVVQ
jgi:hypothetical protein